MRIKAILVTFFVITEWSKGKNHLLAEIITKLLNLILILVNIKINI